MSPRITNINSPQHPVSRSFLPAEPNFKPGEIIRGTVIQKFGGGEVLVSSKGKQFLALTSLDLAKGGEHDFLVKSLGNRVELKVLNSGNIKLKSPIQLWASSRNLRAKVPEILYELASSHDLKGIGAKTAETIKRLSQLMPALIFSRPVDDGSQWLSKFLFGSGLFWESRVARYLIGNRGKAWNKLWINDLKGILLTLEKQFKMEGGRSQELESMAMKVGESLSLIEQDQLLNLSSMKDELGWFWFIPGFHEEGFRKAEIFVEKEEMEEEINFHMSLEFTRLGQMDVDVSMVESVINVKIMMADDENISYMRDNIQLLEDGLESSGFVIGKIYCDRKDADEDGMAVLPLRKGSFPSIHLVI